MSGISSWQFFVAKPRGGWAAESKDNPYVEGVPLMAWVSGQMQAAGVEEEDAVAGLCVEVVRLARGDEMDREYLAFLVEQAVAAYCAARGALDESEAGT